MAHTRLQAVVFDLYETLIIEFDPDWHPKKTPAERLGVQGEVFARVWRSRKAARMTQAVDYRDVVREVCQAAGIVMDAGVESTLNELTTLQPRPT